MAHRLGWAITAALVIGISSPAAATCNQVAELLSQGLSIGQVADVLGAPVGAVQACLAPHSIPANPRHRLVGPSSNSAAGPAPFGAAGPAPLGAAGPAPLGAAGPPPLGAAGPAPFNAGHPAAVGSTNVRNKTP
jgi:hypothetical protein